METSEPKAVAHEKDPSQCVRVAVNIRPLITPELLVGCTDCITVAPGEPQVQIGSHVFTFDYVYGSTGLTNSTIYEDCVAPLLEALFNGYNATVLAYGQTGSGKTYTMGTNYTGNESDCGIIPKVMENIFLKVEKMKDSSEILIRVSFIEIFKEEVYDLLDPNISTLSKIELQPQLRTPGISRAPIQIRETVHGGITLSGVMEAEVRTKEEMASYLSRGSLSRATGSTNMNSQSSRSHAIFTISLEQKRISQCHVGATDDDAGYDILSAKLHLVDLAGSERAKRTGADGMRLKEGIHINKGLLALGNVISALGDDKKRKEGGHVPYRDSKLTRLLQDSLGGNSKTVMIACVSPADSNAEETLNTLKYANRARNIQNKAIINRDPAAAQMQKMRNQIEQLQNELLYFRGDASAPYEEIEILRQKIFVLEASNADLQRELKERHISCEHFAKQALDAQVEKDTLLMKLESAGDGKSQDQTDSRSNKDSDLVRNYVTKIHDLERELFRIRNMYCTKHSNLEEFIDSDDDGMSKIMHMDSHQDLPSTYEIKTIDLSGDVKDDEKELEHSSLQEKFDKELKELDQKLELKEAEMKQFSSANTSVLKQHYERRVQELEQEKRALQKEIEELRNSLTNISSTSDESTQKLKEDYLQKLNALEAQVSELKKKQDAQSQLLRQKQKSDEAAKRLQDEIQRIKSQKVQLQHKIKQESEQFRLWKASREKEVLQLKKEGRKNEFEMHKLLALNQRQKMVLQRKTEEASMATRRLKELLESRRTSSRETFGNGSNSGIQALMQGVEHELEVIVRVHEVRAEYDHQMQVRAQMAKEAARLKQEAEAAKQKVLSDSPQKMSPGARNSRIVALENMLATSSSTLVSMASQLSEAEERERVSNGKGRWNHVRSLHDAKNVMNYLFNLASAARCQLRDREAVCRERDSQLKELKEKVVKLGYINRQLEMHKKELLREKSLEGSVYDLRKGPVRKNVELSDDMDTSESEHSEDDEWKPTKKRKSKNGNNEMSSSETATTKPTDEKVECCTCSKLSLCKTAKCDCRSSGNTCGEACGCKASKCTNRGGEVKEETGSDEAEKNRALASQGALLLQSAFEPATEDCGGARKPLSDIGNTGVKSKPPKAKRRWRKSVVKLVTVAPEANPDVAPEVHSDLALPRLPRAMRAAGPRASLPPLRERNCDQARETAAGKDGESLPPSASVDATLPDDKENR